LPESAWGISFRPYGPFPWSLISMATQLVAEGEQKADNRVRTGSPSA
jgi:hypothetical protein